MNSFLKLVAQDIYSKTGENMEGLCLVFPSQRAGLYFKNYLSELTHNPIWAPKTITINELMQEIAGLTLADPVKLLFEVYQIYKQEKKSTETFDDFYFWGEMMLNDFDDIDKYLVNPEDLFKNLESLKSIQDQFTYLSEKQIEAIRQFWSSFDPQKHSSHQQDFISIWKVLPAIYKKLNSRLKQSGIAYEGMIYRQVARAIEGKETLHLSHGKYIFVGFNALNACEKKLFRHLQNNRQADFYWDYDQSYLDNPHHEAGFFLRDHIQTFKMPLSFTSQNTFDSLAGEKLIEIISVPGNVGQAKIISEQLKHQPENISRSPDQTAIVMADEDLLVPVLQSIPDSIENVNITMGYPVINTPIYSLLEHLIDLQKNAKKDRFYHKNVLAILNHQYINHYFNGEANDLIRFIQSNNRIMITNDELATCNFFGVLFSQIKNHQEIPEYFLTILHTIYQSLKPSEKEITFHTPALEREYIYHIYLSINRVKEVVQEQQVDIRIDTYIRLIRKIIRNLRIPFTGEPLSGLQVMGILETRLLDFKNLFITSVNEGVFPKTEASLSFVPYNLRRGFGLPTIEHQDAIYAYYFYRLMQRAENITLIYNSNTDGLQTGEMSRFLYQIKYESPWQLKEKSLGYSININQPRPIEIEKTQEVQQQLLTFLASSGESNYLSPSGLSIYLRCKLRFYFRYIAGLKEQDEVTEEIDAPMFGNILHETMDHLYRPLERKTVLPETLNEILKNDQRIRDSIEHAFTKDYFKNHHPDYSGKNKIIREIIGKYVKQILRVDASIAPFDILSLEETYPIEIPVQVNGNPEKAKLGGKIDRVDRWNNAIRIIDYKTGKDDLQFKNIEALFSENKNDQNSAVFQTLIYSKFYRDLKKPELPIIPGVYSVRKLFENHFEYNLYCKENKRSLVNYEEVADEFLGHLTRLVEEIFNPEIPFLQTEEVSHCEYCPYRKICHR
ncbi:MAG: PD-(D/E)XK nuclease family protein [Bacteroidales bacterium]|jgi:RecB family exonuclease|nr:PD-(D/E)XK nuclease family protein [Bacteroidales bacterium]